MIWPVDVFVGPNHLREVYPFPVMLNVGQVNPSESRWYGDEGWLLTKELIVDCAHDAQMVRNRVALEAELARQAGERELWAEPKTKRRWQFL